MEFITQCDWDPQSYPVREGQRKYLDPISWLKWRQCPFKVMYPFLFLLFILLIWVRARERERFPTTGPLSKACDNQGCTGQSQEPGTQSRSPMWVTGTQPLEPSLAASWSVQSEGSIKAAEPGFEPSTKRSGMWLSQQCLNCYAQWPPWNEDLQVIWNVYSDPV